MKAFVKDPDATLDYSIDWSLWLDDGDTISTSAWTVEAGLTKVPASEQTLPTSTRVFISGGTVGENYTVTNRITTVGGRTDERSFLVQVRQR